MVRDSRQRTGPRFLVRTERHIMIRRSLQVTKRATFALNLPNPFKGLMPRLVGTGFFVSADGVFVTAAHVVTENYKADGTVRGDIGKGDLMTEPPPGLIECLSVTDSRRRTRVESRCVFAGAKIRISPPLTALPEG